jgi:dTDP-4-amino-4,6-dideoxygalactose transaminase
MSHQVDLEGEMKRIPFDIPQWNGDEVSALMESLGREAYENPVESLESRLAFVFGRARALVVPTPSVALFLVMSALEMGEGDEVVVSPLSWFAMARAVPWKKATLTVSDIDPWSFTLDPEKAARKIGPRSRLLLVANSLGHPADWKRFEALSRETSTVLVEDATESLFSESGGRRTGSFGDISILAFGSPHPNLGESYAAILTDREDLDLLLRTLRGSDSGSLPPKTPPVLPMEVTLSPALARLGLLSLGRLPAGLKKRALLLESYQDRMRSFEGVKDLYQSPEVEWVNWFAYIVHLGTRFSVLSRNAIVEDLRGAGIEARPFPAPLHLHPWFLDRGFHKGMAPIAEKLAERAIALPFHSAMGDQEASLIVERFKEAATNVGAGSAIY